MKKKRFPLQWQALTSTLSTTMVLVLMGLVVLSVLTARRIEGSVRENLPITITLDDKMSDSEIERMQAMLKTERYVNDVKLNSADQVLKEQIAAIGSDPRDFIGFNPYFSELEMSMHSDYANSDSLSWIIPEVKKKYNGVTDINYQKDLVDNLNDNLNRITFILLSMAGLLLIVLVALISSTVRLSLYSRRFVIQTMTLVGASWGFIRRPFLFRSFWIGLIAAIAANGILLAFIRAVISYDSSMTRFITLEDIGIMAGSVLVLGLFIMLCCTAISVNHFIKLKDHQLYER